MTSEKLIEKHKFKFQLLQTVIVSSFVAGGIWANLNNRVGAIEKENSPTRLEHDYLNEKLVLVKDKLDNVPQISDVKEVKNALGRIEKQLDSIGPRLRSLENDVAVIAASQD